MVMGSRRRGASKLGCLVSLALFIAALYYGVQVGTIYWRYYSLMDDMRAAARFASTRSDLAIRQELIASMDSLGIPAEAKRQLTVRRWTTPFRIAIWTQYRELLELPLRPQYLQFRPRVETRF